MTTQGYARPELLAETEWLAQRLNDPNIRIVDCEVPDGYNRAHIPGAVNVGANTYLKGGQDRIHVMSEAEVAEFMGGLGIGNDTLVVAYDSRSSLLAARFWWVLNYYGHTNVKVLNGGWRKWVLERRPITDKPASVARATFSPRVNPSLIVKGGDLKAQVSKPGVAIWDVRSLAEHTGENTRGNKHAGHIPGACHLEYLSVMDTEGLTTFKPASEIRRMLTHIGVTPDKQVYTY